MITLQENDFKHDVKKILLKCIDKKVRKLREIREVLEEFNTDCVINGEPMSYITGRQEYIDLVIITVYRELNGGI